jgi:hypothetical protein
MGFFSKKPYLSLHSLRFLAPTPLTETLHALYAMFGYSKANRKGVDDLNPTRAITHTLPKL